MKTQAELQSELYKQTTRVEDAKLKLDKAELLLSLWVQEYGFRTKPSLSAAISFGGNKGERNKEAEQSYKWFYDYATIYSLIDIVSDYVHESKEVLEKALG